MFRRFSTALALAVFLWLLCRKVENMIDPLKETDLTDEEIRRYRYLLALQDISGVARTEASVSADAVREFIETRAACQCFSCGRWYVSSVAYCPHDHVTTIPRNTAQLDKQVSAWEEFRKRYAETTRIKGITRVIAVRLHYMLEHTRER